MDRKVQGLIRKLKKASENFDECDVELENPYETKLALEIALSMLHELDSKEVIE